MAVVASTPDTHDEHFHAGKDSGDSFCDASANSAVSNDDPHLQDLPSPEMLASCADLTVLASDGTVKPFSSLYTSTPGQLDQRHLVIFVRHFFCGMCQDYLRALAHTLTPDALAATTPPTAVSIIGCGQPSRIADYASTTSCPYPIYADPSRALYDALGMTSNLAMGSRRPKYQTTSTIALSLKSIGQGLVAGRGAVQGGNFSQIGGEFLFGPDGTPLWCHRMKHTRDHTDIDELAKVLGAAKS